MTLYQELIRKAELCRAAAYSVEETNIMRWIWIEKANQLEERAANLPVVTAKEYVIR